MTSVHADGGAVADLEVVVAALEAVAFRLPTDARLERETARTDLIAGISRYLAPSGVHGDEPAVGLVAGLTGTGKSTIVNSLAGRRITAATAIRPTTAEPVIWAHRRHAGRYWQEFIAKVEKLGPSADVVVDEEALLEHLTLIDTPPPHSGEGVHLLGLADLVVFVASATRYADSKSWELLERIRGRGLPILFVLNRLPREASSSQGVLDDYAAKLAAERYIPRPDASLLFAVYEHRIDSSTDGLPPGSVAGLRKELSEIGDPSFRAKITGTAREALFADLGRQAEQMAAFARQEAETGRALLAMGEQSYNARIAAIESDLEVGKYAKLAGEWDPKRLGQLLARHVAIGAQDTAAAWSEDPVGRRIVELHGASLWQASGSSEEHVTLAVEAWTKSLEDLAAKRSQRRRMMGRTRRKLGALLRANALSGADAAVSDGLVDRYGSRGGVGIVRTARAALLDSLGEAFQADASRFRSAIGPIERLEELAGILEEKADSLGSNV